MDTKTVKLVATVVLTMLGVIVHVQCLIDRHIHEAYIKNLAPSRNMRI